MVRAAILALAIPFGAQPPAPPPLLISPSELAAALGDRSLVLLHVADRAESFAQGHIPGARFVATPILPSTATASDRSCRRPARSSGSSPRQV